MVRLRSRPRRPRWQLTTRPRFAVTLGLAGLTVAGLQTVLADHPLPGFQLAVVVFWTVLGAAYLASATVQHLRERRRPRHRAAGTTAAPTPEVAAAPTPGARRAVPTPTRAFPVAGPDAAPDADPAPAPDADPAPDPESAPDAEPGPAPAAAESTDVRLSPWPLGAQVRRALHAAVDSHPTESTEVHAFDVRDVVGAGTGRTARR